MQCFVFLVKMETVKSVYSQCAIYFECSGDIFNKVVIFFFALFFFIYRYICHSKKYHWGCVHVCVGM